MSEKRYPVHLSTEQRQELQHLIHAGRSTAHQQMAARVLLKADESNEQPSSSSQIAEALEISPRTVIRIKQRFVQLGLATALSGNYPKE
jgi:CRP-like cAMP-binding protein